jgi:two-component system sensor histidine kinase QseC
MISIRRQLTRELLLAALTLGGAGFLALYLAARSAVVRQFDAALQAKALAVSTLTEPGPDGVRVRFTDRFLRGFDDRRPRDFFEIWDAENQPVARSESLGARDLAPPPPRLPRTPVRWNLTLPNGRPGRAIGFSFQPKTPGAAAAGPEIRLIVASDRTELDETLWQWIALASASSIVIGGATGWLLPRVLRRGLQPLDRLGEQAAAIDAASLATRFQVGALPRELLPIAGRLNELLARIQQSFERERRFAADLAHELRTPLAELRSQAECALKWPESRDPAADRETLAIATQMELMVAHMLTLARGEQRLITPQRTVVALDRLVRDHLAKLADRAARRGLTVRADFPPLEAAADPVLLRSILGNLLENAVDYAAAGGIVEVQADRTADLIRLRVANTTAEIEPADLPRMFERFWRKEAARSGGQHVGLGLALARTFAEAMHGTLTADLPAAAWLVVTLAWPAA